MALDPFLQALELINQNSRIFLTTHKDFNEDNLVSIIALDMALKKISKEVFSSFSYSIPKNLCFLPGIESYKPFQPCRDFILSIDTRERKIKEIRYEDQGQRLKIFLTPESEPLREGDILPEAPQLDPHLIITLGAHDLESLGKIFEENPQIFFNRPIINIDRNPANENFGEVNLISLTSGSLAEIVSDFLEYLNESLIDETLATLLLTGIVTATNNFRSPLTTPKTLSRSAFLMNRGARHQLIIKHLYKEKGFEFLKLFGKVISRSRYFPDVNLATSYILKEDFEELDISVEIIPRILEEFRHHFLQPDLTILFWNSKKGTENLSNGLGHSFKDEVLKLVQKEFDGTRKDSKILIQSTKSIEELEESLKSFLKDKIIRSST